MLLKEFITKNIDALLGLYPKEEARNLVLMLCEEYLGTHSYTHIVDPQTEVDPSRMPVLQRAMERMKNAEPIQYVLGYADFCDLRFKVTPDVLIPRPETELLVREAVKSAKRIVRSRGAYGKFSEQVRILDMCTGSGCIAWSVLAEVPEAQVVGVDISEKALAVAGGQDFGKSVNERPLFMRADVLDIPDEARLGRFDIIISNPPYVMESQKSQMRPNVRDYEPGMALFVPDEDPLVFYRAISRWASLLLAPGGTGLVEINDELGPETLGLFKNAGFSDVSIMKDFNDRNRIVTFMARK